MSATNLSGVPRSILLVGAIGALVSALKSVSFGQTKHRLAIARRLHQAMCAQYPDRLITLCDGDGRVLATSRRPSPELLQKPQT